MSIPVRCVVVLSLAACSRSEAARTADAEQFDPIASVVMHPRCINCHQDESPRQTDARILHQPLVVRGRDGSPGAGPGPIGRTAARGQPESAQPAAARPA